MKGSLLLVEDSPTQAAEYRSYLQRAGYEVHISTDGFDALVLANPNIDAIILDVNLPTLDGFQVCRRLRRDPDTAGIPIVMLTSSTSAAETLFGLEVGANDYIPKDEFAIEQLLVSLEILLREKQHDEQ
jgi:DNA-binding response OmpR family regulator